MMVCSRCRLTARQFLRPRGGTAPVTGPLGRTLVSAIRAQDSSRNAGALLLSIYTKQKRYFSLKFPATPADVEGMSLAFKTKPWGIQQHCVEEAIQTGRLLLALEMGYGKTKIAIDTARNSGCRRVLVLCPKSVIPVWPEQIREHWADPLPAVLALDKPNESGEAKAARVAAFNNGVVVTNYEAAAYGCSATKQGKLAAALAVWKPDMIVCDESHRIKSPSGQQSKFVYKLAMAAAPRIKLCLTGTPLPHSHLDIFGQARFLAPGTFGTGWVAFRAEYAVMGGPTKDWIVGYKNAEKLAARMGTFSVIGKTSDVIDLPETQDLWRWGAFAPAEAAAYRRLERDSFVELASEASVDAANALVLALRLQQLTAGMIPTAEGPLRVFGTPKREMLHDYIEALPQAEAVVVFTRFKNEIQIVADAATKLERPWFRLDGEQHQLAEWKESAQAGRGPLLACNIRSGGAGVSMTDARYAVYLSTGFSLGDYMQSRARLHRPGQARHVVYCHIGVDGTIDRTVSEALAKRQDLVEAVIEKARGTSVTTAV